MIGSGDSWHDFNAVAKAYFQKQPVPIDHVGFERFLEFAAAISAPLQRKEKLLGWRDVADSYYAHPEGSSEHLMPFMVAAGSGGPAAWHKCVK